MCIDCERTSKPVPCMSRSSGHTEDFGQQPRWSGHGRLIHYRLIAGWVGPTSSANSIWVRSTGLPVTRDRLGWAGHRSPDAQVFTQITGSRWTVMSARSGVQVIFADRRLVEEFRLPR